MISKYFRFRKPGSDPGHYLSLFYGSTAKLAILHFLNSIASLKILYFSVKSKEFLRNLIARDGEGSSALSRKVHSLT